MVYKNSHDMYTHSTDGFPTLIFVDITLQKLLVFSLNIEVNDMGPTYNHLNTKTVYKLDYKSKI